VSGFGTVSEEVLAALDRAQTELAGTHHEATAAAISERLRGPLRVAISGRVKAGKSTLLNALVGAHLAPTDASECTRIVTWYGHGSGYQVSAQLRNGGTQALLFSREDGELKVELGGLAEDLIDVIHVKWPASALESVTLIDTPGLASIDDKNSRRTRDFLGTDSDETAEADAVIYLMRHLHSSDVEFLDAFMDRSVSESSPVNAVAVLSRADEIGAARLDAMESATRIAKRYSDDALVKGLAATVVPVAGLLAETGQTLREDEATSLRAIANEPDDVREAMLLSVGQFLSIESGSLTVEVRRELLSRLGMFGLRLAVDEIRHGATTASLLSTRLIAKSGVTELRAVIADHFLPRARTLQARTALASLRSLAHHIADSHPHVSELIDSEAERIEASAVDFARLRAAHLLATSQLRLNDAEGLELRRVLLGQSLTASLGLPDGSDTAAIQEAAIAAIDKWRKRAGHPLADPVVVEVCEAAARTAEAIYMAATR
jgi:hypothetical protein